MTGMPNMQEQPGASDSFHQAAAARRDIDWLDVGVPLARHWRLLILGPLCVGLIALGVSFTMPPFYSARTVFLPPQQQQSSAMSAVASLGALSGLLGGAGAIKSPADQYVSLLQSATVSDGIVDDFKLMEAYKAKFRFEARDILERRTRVTLGKRDGIITLEFEDTDAQRAAAIANRYVERLRELTDRLALTEAKQRRVLFEGHLKETRDRLLDAQRALEASGFNQGALRAEPKAAAESYARLKAEATAASVRLQALRRNLSESTPEVQQQLATVAALQAQVALAERSLETSGGADYIGKYREFKYQEALFDVFARQYEVARLDESRDGGLIQVVDRATVPEWKSRPKRLLIAFAATVIGLLALAFFLVIRHFWRESAADPARAAKLAQLSEALRKR